MPTNPFIAAFQRATSQVANYREFLARHSHKPERVTNTSAFGHLPILDKASTFASEPIFRLLALDNLSHPSSVLTSSGHSGIFAFGVSSASENAVRTAVFDHILDLVFEIRSRRTLLINGLPMGVKVPTAACTLAETSVRPDMIVGLVKAFSASHDQIILVGETAFLKHTLELGCQSGVHWPAHRVHVVVGEEPIAENARIYLESLLGIDRTDPNHALVVSSMGVAEVGLNLFAEAPPRRALIGLRRLLHSRPDLRAEVLGLRDWVPMLFTYDPNRIYVEFVEGRLVLTTLEPDVMIPLIRYATGDCGQFVTLPESLRAPLEEAGVSWEEISAIPIVAIEGRGEFAAAGDAGKVFPEAVKEGIYLEASLAELITANFRLVSGPHHVRIRLQLSPGVTPPADVEEQFTAAIATYVKAPFEVSCEPYESFRSGMTLDYERKFNYLGP